MGSIRCRADGFGTRPFVPQGNEGCGTPAGFKRAMSKFRCRAEGLSTRRLKCSVRRKAEPPARLCLSSLESLDQLSA